MKRMTTASLWLVATLLWAGSGLAKPTPADRCQAGKHTAAGSYIKCRERAVAQYVLDKNANKVSNHLQDCYVKFIPKWLALEQKATGAGSACPTTNDGFLMADFLTKQSQIIYQALLTGSNLFSAGADLSNTDLDYADLSNLDLTGGDLSYSDFTNVKAIGTNFTNANLAHTTWVLAELNGANLSNADMTAAVLDDIHAINLGGCPASLPTGSACIDNNLVGKSVSLSNANLSGANLSSFDVSDSDFDGANLNGADFTGATMNQIGWSQTICPDGTVSNSNGSNPESCCVHLNGHAPASCSP